MNIAIVTGGSGFVGTHLLRLLLEKQNYDLIYNIDLVEQSEADIIEDKKVIFCQIDLREPFEPDALKLPDGDHDIDIYNLAAICRIPGFPDIDYFRTNIKGAEYCCQLAEHISCNRIIFTSSIAPYGASEDLKTEESIPQPKDPYGSSKLAAEYIHKGWQQCDPQNRSLVILRPGIIFGKGEQANFTRLYNSMKKGFFVYPGRRDTRKACVYVKDVARACSHYSESKTGIHLYNCVYPVPPTIEEICETVAANTDAKRPLFKLPSAILLMASYLLLAVGKSVGKSFNGIHPDRVKKVMISTNVSGEKLKKSSFDMKYNLAEGIRDWYTDCNQTHLG